jgi:uncharacterized protein
MFRSILPKEYAFFDFFDNHIALCLKLSQEILSLANGKGSIDETEKSLKDLEKQMDQITLQCTEALHKTFITPIDRTDILKLIKRMDSIADSAYRAISRIKIYELNIRPDIKEIAEILVKSIEELQIALKLLKDMKDIDTIRLKCQKIRELESQGDDIFKKAISRVFKEGDAIAIIKWKEIYEKLEKAINRCEDTANLIEEILIESA